MPALEHLTIKKKCHKINDFHRNGHVSLFYFRALQEHFLTCYQNDIVMCP